MAASIRKKAEAMAEADRRRQEAEENRAKAREERAQASREKRVGGQGIVRAKGGLASKPEKKTMKRGGLASKKQSTLLATYTPQWLL